MVSYPKIKSVVPLLGKRIRVTFTSGETKVYDCTPLLKDPPFLLLKNDAFFRQVHLDNAGYGVVWNDKVDLSESELWINGITEPPAGI
jgi:hypothetical protein